MNEALCAENCLGRWIWKSGDLLHSAQVPWEVQAINTCPDNFLWESGKSGLITVAPGLYQLQLGFSSRKTPIVRVFINGEVIFTVRDKTSNPAISDNTSTITGKENHFDGNTLLLPNKHSAGNVTGLTLNEFIALPARARVTLCFDGESAGEGFVCIHKL